MYYHVKVAEQKEPDIALFLSGGGRLVNQPTSSSLEKYEAVQAESDLQASLAFWREVQRRQKIGQSLRPAEESQRLIRVLPIQSASWQRDGQSRNMVQFAWVALLVVAIIGGLLFLFRPVGLPGVDTVFRGAPATSPFYFLVCGVLTGLPLAASVGPVGILCMQRTVSHGPIYGFVAGMGRSVAMTLYSALAAFGMQVVTTFLVHQEIGIRLLGGLLLLYLGIKTMLSRPAERAAKTTSRSLGGEALATFLLSFTNPLAILLFAATFSGIGIGGPQSNAVSSLMVVLGVFLGTLIWNGFIVGIISLLRTLLRNTGWMVWVNRLSGGWIAFQGVSSLYGLLSHVFS